MTALERIKGIEKYVLEFPKEDHCCGEALFLLRAFHVMREIAIELEKSDFHQKLSSEEIDDIFNIYMNMDVITKQEDKNT